MPLTDLSQFHANRKRLRQFLSYKSHPELLERSLKKIKLTSRAPLTLKLVFSIEYVIDSLGKYTHSSTTNSDALDLLFI